MAVGDGDGELLGGGDVLGLALGGSPLVVGPGLGSRTLDDGLGSAEGPGAGIVEVAGLGVSWATPDGTGESEGDGPGRGPNASTNALAPMSTIRMPANATMSAGWLPKLRSVMTSRCSSLSN